jgi:hypothetical protein
LIFGGVCGVCRNWCCGALESVLFSRFLTSYLVVLVETDAVVLLHLPCFLYLFNGYLVVFVEIDAVVLLLLSCFLVFLTSY